MSPIVIYWIASLVIALALTIAALLEAHRDWNALRKFNGSARGVVARATIRREWFRLATQVALLVVALPAITSTREIVMTPSLLALLMVPLFILANTLSDRAMRDRLAHKLAEEIVHERNASLLRMEDRLNVRADAREDAAHARADEHAKAAGDRAAVVTKQAGEIKVTADETAVEVHDIHDATVEPGK
jgi:hypothetical protein